jgi:hypothetical protein
VTSDDPYSGEDGAAGRARALKETTENRIAIAVAERNFLRICISPQLVFSGHSAIIPWRVTKEKGYLGGRYVRIRHAFSLTTNLKTAKLGLESVEIACDRLAVLERPPLRLPEGRAADYDPGPIEICAKHRLTLAWALQAKSRQPGVSGTQVWTYPARSIPHGRTR